MAVLDLMLPGTDGWRITETLRAEGIETPIVIVSARGSEHDKVHALGIGGDDYLSKPFGMRELVARVEAVLRRAGMAPAAAGAETITAAGLVIDPNLHAALLDGEDAGLTPTEFRLLYVLAGERGRALSRDQLQQRVWGIRTVTATAPSTSACASCATRSTAARARTPTSRPTTASATGSMR